MSKTTSQKAKEKQIARILKKFMQLNTRDKKLINGRIRKMINSKKKRAQP